jgi:hypothetical protein
MVSAFKTKDLKDKFLILKIPTSSCFKTLISYERRLLRHSFLIDNRYYLLYYSYDLKLLSLLNIL